MTALALAAMRDELAAIFEKTAYGRSMGRSFGMAGARKDVGTRYMSAGVINPKPVTRKMPRMPGSRTLPGSLGKMPKPKGETNNQASLRRGLSNIQTPNNS
jgi:hypothetical protein